MSDFQNLADQFSALVRDGLEIERVLMQKLRHLKEWLARVERAREACEGAVKRQNEHGEAWKSAPGEKGDA